MSSEKADWNIEWADWKPEWADVKPECLGWAYLRPENTDSRPSGPI